MKRLSSFILNNRLELIVLGLILGLSLFLRIYKIDQYMTFLGDEGRDAIVIKNILVDHHLPLLGPTSSVGNIYLGPLYYYMMAVSMSIFWLNPVAAAVMVAVIGTAVVGLVYYLVRQWSLVGAVAAATLYTLSPVNIIYSRSSWNPDPAPFFSILGIIGLFQAHQTKNYLWLIPTGFAAAAAVQMHYLSLILLPIFGLIWVGEVILQRRGEARVRHLGKGSLLGVAAFLFTMSPMVIFDLRHNFLNYRALGTIFSGGESAVSLNIFSGLGRFTSIYSTLVKDYISGDSLWLFALATLLVVSPLILAVYRGLSGKFEWKSLAIIVWLLGGILGLTLYKGNVYDHYLMFLNPAPFILIGVSLGIVAAFFAQTWKKLLLLILIVPLVIANIARSPLSLPPGNQIGRTQEVARFVINEAQNRDFNFALIAARNYDAAYQFYLDLYGYKPKQVPAEVTSQLFVVCEDAVCQPINNPKYEIAGFGWSKIAYEKDIAGVKLFKLVHNPTGANDAL